MQGQTRCWSEKDREVYEGIKAQADKVRILAERYYDGCMQARNRHLVDNSSVCVCYLRRTTGGTAYTVKYARSKGLKIVEI